MSENIKIINMAVQPIKDLLTSRLNNRIQALTAFDNNPIDNIPDDVKKMRELQALRLRASIEELNDLIEIVNTIYP